MIKAQTTFALKTQLYFPECLTKNFAKLLPASANVRVATSPIVDLFHDQGLRYECVDSENYPTIISNGKPDTAYCNDGVLENSEIKCWKSEYVVS